MKIGIMQPYFFPYLGYFQLIQNVDRFVIYDDVNYIKGGWVNRNFILSKQGPQRITLQLSGASPNKLIKEVEIGDNGKKMLTTISQSYNKATCYGAVFPMLEACILNKDKNLAVFLEFSIREVCAYMGIKTEILISSQIEKDNSLKGSEKVMAICKRLGGDAYVNAIGGQDLYAKDHFKENGISLHFLQLNKVSYPQFCDKFTPNLSIIDVIMFNSPNDVTRLLEEYTLV